MKRVSPNPEIRTRRRDPAEKRAAILAAARESFGRDGYGSTTTAQIARRAGVSEGIVFHHFGSKQGLLAALADEYGRELAAAMFEGDRPDRPPLSPETMLRRAFRHVREHGTLAHLLVQSHEPSDWSVVVQSSRARIVAALAGAFARWSERGYLRRMNPQIVAELLFGLVETAILECFVRGDGSREEEYLHEAVRCIEGAVRAYPVPDNGSKALPTANPAGGPHEPTVSR